MEGQELNCPYQILESTHPLTSIDSQNIEIITNPHQNGAVEHSQANKRGKQKQKEKEKEKETWYKGPWTKSEDRKLRLLVKQYGCKNWTKIAKHMPGRIGKQCRERWHNNLRPNISKNIVWSDEEEMMIIEGHERFGNSWSRIATLIPGRSENDVKNHWNKTKRKLCSSKNIQRPQRLRGLYQSTVLENYIKKKFFKGARFRSSTTTAAAADATGESSALIVTSSATTNAPPPLTAIVESNALVSTAAACIPPAIGENNGVIAAEPDRPLSVDDYDIDGVPFFTFEIAAINEDVELMEKLSADGNGDAVVSAASPAIGGADYAAAACCLAVDETVDEEMNFLRSLFGGVNGGI